MGLWHAVSLGKPNMGSVCAVHENIGNGMALQVFLLLLYQSGCRGKNLICFVNYYCHK
jgi:hypothetical protein